MFQHSPIDQKNHQSYFHMQSTHSFIQNQHSKDATFRKRLHSLLSQNFQLKQSMAKLQIELKTSEQQRRQLKEQLRIVLEEMKTNDQIIQNIKEGEFQYQNTIKHHQEQISTCREELEHQKTFIDNLINHNKNLEAQNQLLIQIKQKYALDLSKLRIDFDTVKASNQRVFKQNQCLSLEVDRLLQQILSLQNEIQSRRNDIEQYQKFVLEKLSNVKDTEQFHQACQQKIDNLHIKYSKYKHKACTYKRERDQLLFHLQHVSREIDSNTLRKYYEDAIE